MWTKVKGWGSPLGKVTRTELFGRMTFKVRWEGQERAGTAKDPGKIISGRRISSCSGSEVEIGWVCFEYDWRPAA